MTWEACIIPSSLSRLHSSPTIGPARSWSRWSLPSRRGRVAVVRSSTIFWSERTRRVSSLATRTYLSGPARRPTTVRGGRRTYLYLSLSSLSLPTTSFSLPTARTMRCRRETARSRDLAVTPPPLEFAYPSNCNYSGKM